MRFGIVILPDQRWQIARERWQRAESYGFDHAWTYDHLGWRDLVDGPWFDAMTTLTAAATVTTRITLGTFVASPNFRHPVHFAREVTALDDISGGRLLLGLGAGGTDFDAAVLGAPPLNPRQRVDRYAEFTGMLDALLREGQVTSSGEYFTAVDARSTPGCLQKPRVPFLMAANGPRSMRIAARFGAGWVTTGPKADDLGDWWKGVADAAAAFSEALAAFRDDDGSVLRVLELDGAPLYSLSSVDAFVDAVGRADELGFTDVITHWPRESSWYAGSERVLDAVASDVLPKWAGS